MKINEQHKLEGGDIVYIASPNCDDRCGDLPVNLFVIHCISLPEGEYGNRNIERLFTNQLDIKAHQDFAKLEGLEVSAHALIRRDGSIIQFVPFNMRAWHAGESEYQGHTKCNNFSIGIELEGTTTTPFESIQYNRLEKMINVLIAKYPTLNRSQIVGHSEIAPQRKEDPGKCFEWHRFRNTNNQ